MEGVASGRGEEGFPFIESSQASFSGQLLNPGLLLMCQQSMASLGAGNASTVGGRGAATVGGGSDADRFHVRSVVAGSRADSGTGSGSFSAKDLMGLLLLGGGGGSPNTSFTRVSGLAVRSHHHQAVATARHSGGGGASGSSPPLVMTLGSSPPLGYALRTPPGSSNAGVGDGGGVNFGRRSNLSKVGLNRIEP